MTIGLLNQLHDHKLTQVRTRAQKQIESWREAIAVVKKAEQEAKRVIELPEELTNIERVENCLKVADYITAIGILGKISENRDRVCDISIVRLNDMCEHFQKDEALDIQIIEERANAKHFKCDKWSFPLFNLIIVSLIFGLLISVGLFYFMFFIDSMGKSTRGVELILQLLVLTPICMVLFGSCLIFPFILLNENNLSKKGMRKNAAHNVRAKWGNVIKAMLRIELYRDPEYEVDESLREALKRDVNLQ